jgi:hypothetical protein
MYAECAEHHMGPRVQPNFKHSCHLVVHYYSYVGELGSILSVSFTCLFL